MDFLTKSLGYIACASIFLFTSCNKFEFDKIAKGAWNPNLAVPIAHSSFGVYDILALQDSSNLINSSQNNGVLTIVYRSDFFSLAPGNLLNIPNITESASLDLLALGAIPVPTFPGTVTSTSDEIIQIDASGSEIHLGKVKSGTLDLNVSTDLEHDLTCEITIPGLKSNGVPVSVTVALPYTGAVPHSGTASIDLTDAMADFTLNNTDFNKLKVSIKTTINGTGQPIYGTEEVNFDFSFNDMKFKNATGYFGQINLGASSDTVEFKFLQNASNAYFELVNPKIRFIAKNTFGLPIDYQLLMLKTVDLQNGTENVLSGYPNSFYIASGSPTGQAVTTEIELNTTNTSGLSGLISSAPKLFVFGAGANTNPQGNVAPLNFISEDSRLNIETEVELPLEGSAYGLEMKDTVNFSFNEDVSLLESVMFRLNIDNGFPMELKSQIVFLDANYIPLFTLFNTPESVIAPALVDNTGRVNKRTEKITDITIGPAQILLLPEVKYLLLNTSSQTLEGPSGKIVKFYDDYTIDLKLGLQIQGKIQL